MRPTSDNTTPLSPWPHRLAVALVCVVFPLIWVGGLVTTYDAGMAVPDWPGTYGYNLFLYPWTTWVAGPWDLFIEHGHRLLGATAGVVTIALVVATFFYDKRRSTRMLTIGALVLVIAQGALGGTRVLLDARLFALIHGCVGPFFFAYCACLAVVTSPRWQQARSPEKKHAAITRSALIGVLLAYGQLVLGAFLRHPSDVGSPQSFRLVLLFHIVVALALIGHVIGLTITTYRRSAGDRWITRPATVVAGLLVLQLLLGFASLIVKYGWPAWLGGEMLASDFTVTAKGFWSSMIVTAHVANGSLILATLATLSVRSIRRFGWQGSSRSVGSTTLLGVTA